MKMLTKFLEQENQMRSWFNKPALDINALTQADATALYQKLDGNMSPENLHCDGEISAAEARRRAKMFTGAAADLDRMGFVRPADLYCI